MLQALKKMYDRAARKRRRQALSNELDSIYAMRRYCNTREVQIVREAKNLDTHELHNVIPARKARSW